MNRKLPTYEDANQRVKVSFFTKLGLDINGIIHVGTNYGYEMRWYQRMGIAHLMGFEPLTSACAQFYSLYPNIRLFPYALGEESGVATLTVYAGDGQGSSLLQEINPDPNAIILEQKRVFLVAFQDLKLDIHQFDCLVIDVEGYELHVLKGFGDKLDQITMLSVELSKTPRYVGQSPAHDVVRWLAQQGFHQLSPIEDHNDVFFLRESLYHRLLLTGCLKDELTEAHPLLHQHEEKPWANDLTKHSMHSRK